MIHDDERLIDYRSDTPVYCSKCGAKLKTEAKLGRIHIGPADLEWAATHGITEEGPASTIWHQWWCPVIEENDWEVNGHDWGPYLIG
jgi:hypothetical protein